jgi:hypothetical protein
MRKRKVVPIRGRFKRDVVTQRQLTELAQLMAASFAASQFVQEVALSIEDRLKSGASIEDGPLTFDRKIGWVPL